MSNKILDAIEMVTLNDSRHIKSEHMNYSIDLRVAQDEMTSLADNVSYLMEGRLQVFFRQSVPESAPPEILKKTKERAQMAIARHLYGDVINDLREVREMLWSDGVSKSPALDGINALISQLSGEMTRFE